MTLVIPKPDNLFYKKSNLRIFSVSQDSNFVLIPGFDAEKLDLVFFAHILLFFDII